MDKQEEDKLTAWFNAKVKTERNFKRHPYSVDYETRRKYMNHGVMTGAPGKREYDSRRTWR